MDDIHTPTIPSGPTSALNGLSRAPEGKESLLDLISEKERVESELSALSSVLDSVFQYTSSRRIRLITNISFQHGVNMSTGLTTFDGFPRNDLDIAQSV